MADSRESEIDSIIESQLYVLSSIRDPAFNEYGDRAPESRPDDAALLFPFHPVSKATFFEFLDVLKVPFIETHKLYHEPTLAGAIGQGGFGEVSFNTNVQVGKTTTVVAIKEFNSSPPGHAETIKSFDSMSVRAITQCFTEICVMKHPELSCHPNVVQLLGITERDSALLGRSVAVPEIWLVIEYATMGSLESYLVGHSHDLNSDFKFRILYDICEGLRALHACDIVHNDLKCSNVLLSLSSTPGKGLVPKISDFGCSVLLAITKPQMAAAQQNCTLHLKRTLPNVLCILQGIYTRLVSLWCTSWRKLLLLLASTMKKFGNLSKTCRSYSTISTTALNPRFRAPGATCWAS